MSGLGVVGVLVGAAGERKTENAVFLELVAHLLEALRDSGATLQPAGRGCVGIENDDATLRPNEDARSDLLRPFNTRPEAEQIDVAPVPELFHQDGVQGQRHFQIKVEIAGGCSQGGDSHDSSPSLGGCGDPQPSEGEAPKDGGPLIAVTTRPVHNWSVSAEGCRPNAPVEVTVLTLPETDGVSVEVTTTLDPSLFTITSRSSRDDLEVDLPYRGIPDLIEALHAIEARAEGRPDGSDVDGA